MRAKGGPTPRVLCIFSGDLNFSFFPIFPLNMAVEWMERYEYPFHSTPIHIIHTLVHIFLY